LRRSQRVRQSALPNDYLTVFLIEADFDLGMDDDPTTYSQAMESSQEEKWMEAMESELKSMDINGVWELVDKPNGFKLIRCNGCLKQREMHKGMQRDSRPDL
jgi:hypothetical protein